MAAKKPITFLKEKKEEQVIRVPMAEIIPRKFLNPSVESKKYLVVFTNGGKITISESVAKVYRSKIGRGGRVLSVEPIK